MKIALIIDHFFPHKGGAESAVYQLAQFLVREQQEVHVFAQTIDSSLPLLPALHLHPLPVAFKGGGIGTYLFGKQVGKAIRNESSFDIVLGFNKAWIALTHFQPHGGTTLASRQQNSMVYRSKIARLWKRILQGFSVKQALFRWIESQQYRQKNTIYLALSQMVKRDMQRFYEIPESSIRVIYNGVDTQKFDPSQKNHYREALEKKYPQFQQKVLFLFVAHNFKLKGLAPLLEAFAEANLPPEAYHLIVLGRGKAKHFERFAKRTSLSVSFLSEDPQPHPYFCGADVFVHPTFYDPCSLVLLEAMAAGLPCLTSQWNGAGELLVHGESGFILEDPWNIRGFAGYLKQLMQASIREDFGKKARLIARAYPWERSFQEILEVFQEKNSS
jgi:UDP-glucose:(heptosyl)LPS alpha-1,3-glucosyltransferase